MSSILLVGEGDFSFSVSFLQQKNPGQDVITSSLLSESEVFSLHRNAEENVKKIKNLGGKVFFRVDATALHVNPDIIQEEKFDVIMFNFPHIGGKSNIKKNRELLKSFFISAEQVLAQNGRIQVTLARGQGGTPADKPMREWQNSWQIIAMATAANLILHETKEFITQHFPEYSSSGFRSQDKHFHTDGAVVHVFERSYCPVLVSENDSHQSEEILHTPDNKKCYFGKYIGKKISRVHDAITKEPCHPFYITKTRVLEAAHKIFGQESQLTEDLPRIINKCDARIPHYQSLPCEMQSDCSGNFERCTTDVGDCDPAYLRCTLLENEFLPKSLDKPGIDLHVGDIYRPCAISISDSPVDIEVMAVNNNCANFEEKSKLFIKELLCEKLVQVYDGEGIKTYHGFWLDIRWQMIVPKQCSKFNTEAVDNVTGRSDIVAVFGYLKHAPTTSVLLLSMLSITKVLYKITDPRILWTRDSNYFKQFSDFPAYLDSTPYSIFPPCWVFDLSFWKNDLFEEQMLLNICRDHCGDSLMSVEVVDTFHEEKSNRTSLCYRLTFKSCDKALSYTVAHDTQKLLRLKLVKCLSIELR